MDAHRPAPSAPRRSFASRVFGYDVFISFALGPPPRGSQSYASDLARRLRERDFSVFFSEEEAPPGMVLDAGLRRALRRSRMLVVIANRGTLLAPRWIRTEVEEFRRLHPSRPIVPISLGAALQDPELADEAQTWLQFRDRIWVDDSADAAERGIASDASVDRLATAPARLRSNVLWRWVVGLTLASMAGLALVAFDRAAQARAELRRAVSLKLAAELPQRLSGRRAGGDERALFEAVAAAALVPSPSTEGALLEVLLQRHALVRLANVGQRVDALAYSPDGRRIAHSGFRGVLEVRDAVTLAPAGPALGRHEEGIGLVVWCGDRRLVTGSLKGNARVWDLDGPAGGRPIGQAIYALDCSPDGRQALTIDDEGKLRLWDTASAAPVDSPIARDAGAVVAAAWQPDGSRIVTSGADRTLRWWDARTGRPAGAPVPEAANGPAIRLVFSRDGQRFVALSGKAVMSLWDAERRVPIGEPSPLKDFTSFALDASGRRVVVARFDGTLQWLDTSNWEAQPGVMRGHQDLVRSLAISPDGRHVASAGGNGRSIRLWDAHADAVPGMPLAGSEKPQRSLAFSPDGRSLAATDESGIRLWSAQTGEPMQRAFTNLLGNANEIVFSPDGRRLATSCFDHTLRRWDPATGQQVGEPIPTGEARPLALAYRADGRHIAVRLGRGIGVWDAATGERVAAGESHTRDDGTMAYAFGGGQIGSSAPAEPLQLWNGATAQPAGRIDATANAHIEAFAFSPIGQRVALAESNGLLRIWDIDGARVVGAPFGRTVPVEGQSKPATRLAYTPDAAAILASYPDGLRLWHAASGELVGTLPEAGLFAVSPTNDRWAFRAADKLRLWPAPAAWAGEICAMLTRNPSEREWREWVSSEIPYACPCPGLPVSADAPSDASPRRCEGTPARSMLH